MTKLINFLVGCGVLLWASTAAAFTAIGDETVFPDGPASKSFTWTFHERGDSTEFRSFAEAFMAQYPQLSEAGITWYDLVTNICARPENLCSEAPERVTATGEIIYSLSGVRADQGYWLMTGLRDSVVASNAVGEVEEPFSDLLRAFREEVNERIAGQDDKIAGLAGRVDNIATAQGNLATAWSTFLERSGPDELNPPLATTITTAALTFGLSEAQTAKFTAWYQGNYSWALPVSVMLAISAVLFMIYRIVTGVQLAIRMAFGRTLNQRVAKLEKGTSTDPKTEERLSALEGQVNDPETGLAATHELAMDAKTLAEEIRRMALEHIKWDQANADFDMLAKLPVGAETWWGCTFEGQHYRIRLWREADTKVGEICTNIKRDHTSGLLADPISFKRLKLRIAGAIYHNRLNPDVPEEATPPVRIAAVDGVPA